MAASAFSELKPLLLLFLFSVSATAAVAQVPSSETFTYVNEGEIGPFITEYDDSYRSMPIFGAPYQLMWHNSTPGQFYVGIRLGLRRQEPFFRWVWDANRGRPVGENATLSFGADGDLVLKEADGRVVWSTGTANRGVVGVKLLSSGNLVLHDKSGRFVWQSFDHPTDTLFVGQTLRLAGPAKIVSRKSEKENSEGMYSLVLERRALTLYMAVASTRKPLPYGRLVTFKSPANLTLTAEDEGTSSWQVGFDLSTGGGRTLARIKYNATNSILRLQMDGNLVMYTYNVLVDYQPTERTFVYFSDRDTVRSVPGCELPTKCGALGVCEDDMCVACPTPRGLLGWSKECSHPKLGACKPGAAAGNLPAARYYKVAGVENFLTRFTKGEQGAVTVDECRRRCSTDCKCLGFFYWEESSRCWLAPAVGTLSKVSKSSHVAYIKYSN